MKIWYEVLIITGIAIVLGMLSNLVHPQRVAISFKRPELAQAVANDLDGMQILSDGPLRVDRAQVETLIKDKDAMLLDSRLPEDFAAQHLPDAVNVSLDLLGEHIQRILELPRDRWLVTYCDGPPCEKSTILGQELMSMGFSHVYIYYDGIEDWQKAGNALESGGLNE